MVEYNNKKNTKNIHENNVINRDYINPKINISPKIKREFKKIGKDCLHVGAQPIVNSLPKE